MHTGPLCKSPHNRNDTDATQKRRGRDRPLRRGRRAGQHGDDCDRQTRATRNADYIWTGHRVLEKRL